MKILHLLPAALLAANAPAQVVLEHIYPNSGQNAFHQLFLWPFEASGLKYVDIDRFGGTITLYHLDHTLYKQMSYADAPGSGPGQTILYLSEHLFDLDDDVEYLYTAQVNYNWFTAIYDEDGTALLAADSCNVLVVGTFHGLQYPIMNTPDGARLVLSHLDSTARVYRLRGSLACFDCEGDVVTGMWEDTHGMGPGAELITYPNPSTDHVTVAYELPPGTKQAELVVTDGNGAEVLAQVVSGMAHQATISVSALPSGPYFYFLRTEAGIVQSARNLVIR